MKVMMKPIEVLAWFSIEGAPRPLRFKLQGDYDEVHVYKVEQILHRSEEKLAGNRMLIYRCQSEIEGTQRLFELKYEPNTYKWYLCKA